MEKLIKNETCEILIIGAGITGLLTAYKFKEQGYDVILVDKDKVGEKSTKKNTGLIQYSSDTMLHKMIGDEKINAIKFYQDSLKTVDELETISLKFQNKNVYKRCPSLYLASNPSDIPTLQKEYEELVANNFNVTEIHQKEIMDRYGINKEYAILTEEDASINPYLYAKEHSNLYEKMGGKLYQAYFLDANNGIATFKENLEINYKYVIFALGYDTIKYKPIKGVVKEVTYAFLCHPQIKTTDIMVWETARPYLYQNTLDTNKVVVGGGDLSLEKQSADHTFLNVKKIKEEFMNWYGLQSLDLDEYYQADFFTFIDGMPKYLIEERSIYLYPYGGNGVVYSLYLINNLLNQLSQESASSN